MIKITNKRIMYICKTQQLNNLPNVLDRLTIAFKIFNKKEPRIALSV